MVIRINKNFITTWCATYISNSNFILKYIKVTVQVMFYNSISKLQHMALFKFRSPCILTLGQCVKIFPQNKLHQYKSYCCSCYRYCYKWHALWTDNETIIFKTFLNLTYHLKASDFFLTEKILVDMISKHGKIPKKVYPITYKQEVRTK